MSGMNGGTETAASAFAWTQRVYYQHTDASGVVFHANYLNFMENARTELLQSLGFDLGKLLREDGVCFVVHSASIRYRKPALLNDLLTITAHVAEPRRARLIFEQQVKRGDESLAEAEVTIACVDAASHRPIPLPGAILDKFISRSTTSNS
jgi:tol-pal system-associated acyl-CoA thioesterase